MPQPTQSLAIAGKTAAGKSTLIRLLVDELRALDGDALIVSFADELVAEVEEQGFKRDSRGFIDALRAHSELKRQDDRDYWLRRSAERMARLADSGVVALVEGVALEREATLLKETGVLLLRVEAGPKARSERLAALGRDPALAYSKDPPEVELDGYSFDLTIKNSGSLESLRRQAAKLALRLLPI